MVKLLRTMVEFSSCFLPYLMLTVQMVTSGQLSPCPTLCSCESQSNSVLCVSVLFTEVPTDVPRSAIFLDLSKNLISTVWNSSFSGLTSLKNLSLYDNALTFIDNNAFADLLSLETLDLSFNDIREINAHHFFPLLNLRSLVISNNLLLNVTINALQNLVSLVELKSDNNEYSWTYDFSDMKHLKILQLDQCWVREFQVDNFRSLNNLRTLQMSDNDLEELPVDILKELESLSSLHLARNFIRSLKGYDFGHHPNLIHIDFSKNNIDSLEGVRLGGLKELQTIILSFNKITTISESFSHGVSVGPPLVFKMDHNPIICDCRLKWLANYIRDNKGLLFSANCASPDLYVDQYFPKIDSTRLHCAPTKLDSYARSNVVTFGDQVTLSCPVTGDPFPQVTWYHHNESTATTVPVPETFIRSSVKGFKVHFDSVTFDHAGLYTCKGSNEVGSTEVPMALSVVPASPSAATVRTECSCNQPIIFVVIICVVIVLAMSVTFVLYRMYLKASRTQSNMNYATLREPDEQEETGEVV